MTTLGAWNRRITILAYGTTTDPDTGAVDEGVETVFAADVPAAIRPVSVREFVAAAATQALVTTRIELPYIDGIKANMKVRDDLGKLYTIEGPPLPDAKTGLEYLTLACSGGEVG